ncbi:MAG: menaquinone biosynthetic enzyme MqnA/MqnD family protein [Trueperaceae bacterium]
MLKRYMTPNPQRLTPQPQTQRLGIVSYTNVAPLYWQLTPWEHAEFVRGVPTELNQQLLAGSIDLTLISSIEFVRHREELKALPDFSIATLGPVQSVMLFHWDAWEQLDGKTIALTTDSATSVELLNVLLRETNISAECVPMKPNLETMLQQHDAALLIGDIALKEAVAKRSIHGKTPQVTDLGEAWYKLTKLPFTFAVWASRKDNEPSQAFVNKLREAREYGLGHLSDVADYEAKGLGLPKNIIQRYLANFRYYLMPPDIDGLLTFAKKAVPDFKAKELEFWWPNIR